MTRVPFVDLNAGYRRQRAELLEAIAGVLDSGAYVGGPAVAQFERDFAVLGGATHAIAVKTGTDAILLVLRALGIGAGDEVVTAPNSFFATAEAIALAGATPVFADVADDTLLLDPARVAAAVTPRTRAVIPVHLYGQCADVDAVRAAAGGLPIIEDSCQAHGATRGGRAAGSLGTAAAFSFYPTKNLGALGEGGAITTSDAALAGKLRALRDHGQSQKHVHEVVGYNARLDALQCAALSVKLRDLGASSNGRRRAAAAYRRRLEQLPAVRTLAVAPGNEHVYHLFVVRVLDRERVAARLKELGVDTAVHYPTPIHRQPAFAHLGHGPGSFPIAERAAGEILSLPMWPEISDEQVARVCDALGEAVA